MTTKIKTMVWTKIKKRKMMNSIWQLTMETCQRLEFLISRSLLEEAPKTATTITTSPQSLWGKNLGLFSKIKRATTKVALQKILLLSETLITRTTEKRLRGQSCCSLTRIKLSIPTLIIRSKFIKKKTWNNFRSEMATSKRVSKRPSKTSSTTSLMR